MFRCFSLRIGIAAASVLIGSLANADSARTVADAAQQRRGEVGPTPVQSLNDADRAHAAQLGEQALVRGREALSEWQRESEKEGGPGAEPTAQRGGHSKEVDGPPHDEESPLAGRLIVALSSSMPLVMVHDYMQQLAGVPEAVVVLRGFVGGAHTVAPTGRWIEEVRRIEPTCARCVHYKVQVVVDPLIYRALKIEQVPAVAYAPGVTDLSHCDGQQLSVKSIAYGATSIEAAIRALSAEGVPVPEALVEKFRRRGWEYKTPRPSESR